MPASRHAAPVGQKSDPRIRLFNLVRDLVRSSRVRFRKDQGDAFAVCDDLRQRGAILRSIERENHAAGAVGGNECDSPLRGVLHEESHVCAGPGIDRPIDLQAHPANSIGQFPPG